MKHLLIFLLLATFSAPAFAQFPLGGTMSKIKAYFDENVSYASSQEFKTENGNDVLCFTKVRVIGDYTFYFDNKGICTSYVVTYDKNELSEVEHRFDNKFCKLEATKWESEEGIYNVVLLPPGSGANYFSVIYQPLQSDSFRENTLASN